MENVNNTEKVAEVGALGLFSALAGWMGWLALLYGCCMTADYITGTAYAIKAKTWSSSVAREGLWHKCGSLITVGVAAAVDILLGLIINNIPSVSLPFPYSTLLCPIVLVWYIVSELGSILENAGKMGAPIPPFLKAH